jgi:flavin-dependent dehydrogenase
LIGDAAGHVDPIGGVGIYYAMRGGALCASAILEGDIRLFEKYWRNDYGYELCYRAKNFEKFYGKLAFFTWLKNILENIPLQLGLLKE